MWHVPFGLLSDLATVTMIGDMPRKKQSLLSTDAIEAANEETQQRRYDYLCQCANGRHIQLTERERESFYPLDDERIFADILYDLDRIRNLDPTQYPYLSRALRTRGIKERLICVLLNMYAHVLPMRAGNMIGFLQTKTYLQQWGRAYGFEGSTFSWQASLIFFTDIGLLKKYIDNNKPLSKGVFRKAPKYTDDVLGKAESKARRYIEAGIKLNNFTKSEVIKVSGNKQANKLFYGDSRIISTMQMTVDQVFITEANRELDQNGYALPSTLVERTDHIISEQLDFEPFEEEPNPESYRQYKQARCQLKRLQNRFLELSKEIPCEYRRMNKEEKENFGFSTRFMQSVFIR